MAWLSKIRSKSEMFAYVSHSVNQDLIGRQCSNSSCALLPKVLDLMQLKCRPGRHLMRSLRTARKMTFALGFVGATVAVLTLTTASFSGASYPIVTIPTTTTTSPTVTVTIPTNAAPATSCKPKAIKVYGNAHIGKSAHVTILGSCFSGNPKILTNLTGTKFALLFANTTSVVMKVNIPKKAPKGTFTYKLVFKNGVTQLRFVAA